MAKAKKSTTTKRATVEKQVPKRYEVEIYIKREPHDKNILTARFGYWESTNEVKLIEYTPNYGADMEDLIMGDILVGKANISLANTPKEWITNLHKATLGKRYIASEARILNETE